MRMGTSNPDATFYLGLAYHYDLQYDNALTLLEEYKRREEGNFLNEINRHIETVENARKIAEAPIDVEFENVGLQINSEYPDYYPFVTPDESFIVFTTRRRKNINAKLEFDGFYSSDIWYSEVRDGEFLEAQNIGRNINTGLDEQAVGLSHDKNKMFIYIDHIQEFGDIYYSDYVGKKYLPKVKFDEVINSKEFESSATISSDKNTLFFASERAGGFGGKDIYMVRKLPTGEWANPQNLGPKINTPYDEDFPNLFFDDSTLYFASVGHNSIGGYDIFKSEWNPGNNTWSTPENIGYPVNTPEDNLTISFTSSQRHAYVSRWMPDSKGDLDIYRITFRDKDPRETILKGKIVVENSETVLKEGFITVLNNRTQEEVGNYVPDPKNGSVVIILEPGSYNLLVDVEGYQLYNLDLIVKGKSDFKDFMLQDFIVAPN